jgi:acyl-CoA reductase-like NAD-dependent aldehyde dehydrogenase
MISEKEAKRLKGWIDSAVAGGATLLCGGGLRGQHARGDAARKCAARSRSLYREEAFGPVASCLASPIW